MSRLSTEEEQIFREAFQLFDKDKTGLISSSELGDVIRASGQNPSENDIEKLLRSRDKNDDATLDFDEFLEMMSGQESEQMEKNNSDEAVRRAFEQFDNDKSGFVSKSELHSALTHLGEKMSEQEVDEMMTLGDQDKDGDLNYEEFVTLTSDKASLFLRSKKSSATTNYSRMDEGNQGTKKTASVAPMRSNLMPEPKSGRSWIQYETAWTETPLLWFLHVGLRYWIRFRQTLLRNPLFMWRVPVPCSGLLNRSMTLAEFVLFLGWLAATVGITACAIVFKWDLEKTGHLAVIPTALTFALSTKNSVFTWILGIPFERQIFWHKLLAVTAVSWGWAHGAIALLDLSSPEEGKEEEEDEDTSGLIFTIIMSCMILFSLKPIRRYIWNLFYYLHFAMLIATAVVGFLHGAGGIIFGLGLWIFDYVLRHIYLALIRNPKKVTALRLPSNVIRFTFQKDEFEYSPGQYVFLMVPEVNIFEWHPFSLSSSPHHENVSIHIRVLGNWTRCLYQLLEHHDGPKEMKVFMHGPYGSPEIDIDDNKYQLYLLISGGIGITPMQSLCNHLVYQKETEGRPLKKVWFVWSCADKYMVTATFEHDREWVGEVNKDVQRLPMSFQPDNLRRISIDEDLMNRKPNDTVFDSSKAVDILHTEFYLTRIRNKQEDFASANIRPELQKYVRYGRPQLHEIFMTMRNYAVHVREKRVAVMVCGPTGMIDEVRALSGSMARDGITFDFHGEVFEF